MSPDRPPMSDDRLDATIRDFLAWHAEDLSGAPDRADLLAHIGHGRSRAMRPRQLGVVLVLALLLAAVVATLLVVLARPTPPPVRLLGNGPIILGQNAIDPATGWLVLGAPHLDDSAAVAADGRTMVHRKEDGLWLVDLGLDTERELARCHGCAIDQPPLSISADGTTVSYGWAGELHVVDVPRRSDTTVLRLPDGYEGMGTAVSPDGSRIAYADNSADLVGVVDRLGGQVASMSLALVPDCPDCSLLPVSPAFSPDGRWLAWIVDHGAIEVWVADTETWRPRMAWNQPGCCISLSPGLAWSPDGTRLAVEMGSLWLVDPVAGTGREISRMAQGRPVWLPVPEAQGWKPSAAPTTSASPAS